MVYNADFKMLYDGETYTSQWPPVVNTESVDSRAIMPHIEGLICDPAYTTSDEGLRYLIFGTMDAFSFNGFMTLVLPNGGQHVIQISRSMTQTSWTSANSKQTVTVDGEVVGKHTDGSPSIFLTFVADPTTVE